MAKKRRHAAASSASAGATGRHALPSMLERSAVDTAATATSLDRLNGYYKELCDEVTGIPTALERTLTLHSVVAVVVQNALMYDERVSTSQIALVVIGTSIWMARALFTTTRTPHAALQDSRNRVIFWRIVVTSAALCGWLVVLYSREERLSMHQNLLITLVFLLDIASMRLVWETQGRLTRRQIAFSVAETTFLVTCFSTQLNHKPELIYDRLASVLTGVTAGVHTLVLLTTKYVLLHGVETDLNGAFAKTHERGTKLMESLWLDIDRGESEPLLTGATAVPKKRKAQKSKSRAGALKAGNMDANSAPGQLESAASAHRSVFSEPRVQLAIATLGQTLLLLTQLVLSAFVLYSWELMSALMLSSAHVLWTLGQVRRKQLAPKPATWTLELAKQKSE